MPNYICGQPLSVSYLGNEALFNNDLDIYGFELYYKETQDAVNRITTQLALDTLDTIYVEMGNEYYSADGYPFIKYEMSANDYAKLVEIYAERLKCFFKDQVGIKIGMVTKPITPWQSTLVTLLGDDLTADGKTLDQVVDGVIFHHYYNQSTCLGDTNIASRFECAKTAFRDHIETDFEANIDNLSANFPNQSVWITEWNMLDGDGNKNNGYINTILHASFVQEYALGMLQYNAENVGEIEMATHHRLGDHNVWSVIQTQENSNGTAHFRGGAQVMKQLSKLYAYDNMLFIGNILTDGGAPFDTKEAKSTVIYQTGDGLTIPDRLLVYFTNKTGTDIPLTVQSMIDGKSTTATHISYLKGDHLFTYGPANTTAGKNRFNKTNSLGFQNTDLDLLGYGNLHDQFVVVEDSALLSSQQTVLPANSVGVLEITLDSPMAQDIAHTVDFNVSIYPNPAHNQLTVELQMTTAQTVQISLVSVDGKTTHLHSELLPSGNWKSQYPVTDLAKGMYLMVIRGENGVVTKRVMIY